MLGGNVNILLAADFIHTNDSTTIKWHLLMLVFLPSIKQSTERKTKEQDGISLKLTAKISSSCIKETAYIREMFFTENKNAWII